MTKTMPVIFLGHGNPMNALQINDYTKAWAHIGTEIPRPKAVLSISAHWYIPQTAVTAMSAPRTIHDFGGFPQDLYNITYPAPGDPALANRIRALLSPHSVDLDEQWGLDHGTWSVLRHIYPRANVPVVQLSIDLTKPAAFHYEIGKMLAPLREEGFLIIGSGNLVHNLRAYDWSRRLAEPMIGLFDLKSGCENCSWLQMTIHSSTTRLSEMMQCFPFPRRIIIYLCSM
jgi:4,5-DOPA dioxygenase extradiol